MKGAVIFHLT